MGNEGVNETGLLGRIVRKFDSSPVLFYGLNTAVALLWGYRAYEYVVRLQWNKDATLWERVKTQPTDVLSLLMFSQLVIFYVLRRRSTDVSTDLTSLVLAHVGTWGTLLFKGADPYFSETVGNVLLGAMVVSLGVATLGFASLGRSWGIIPANRGVKTGGLYRLVRHPIYGSYVVFFFAFALAAPSARNLVLAPILSLALYIRARLEERILRRDPEYAAYAEKTRFMLFPWIV